MARNIETWETFVPHRLGDTSGEYEKWRAAVLQVRELPEYKLRKLWKLNFRPSDIEQNKHWAVFPFHEAGHKRIAPGTSQERRRGRTLSAKKKKWIYARALTQAATSILAFYRLGDEMLAETRKDLEGFQELMKKYAHKHEKDA